MHMLIHESRVAALEAAASPKNDPPKNLEFYFTFPRKISPPQIFNHILTSFPTLFSRVPALTPATKMQSRIKMHHELLILLITDIITNLNTDLISSK